MNEKPTVAIGLLSGCFGCLMSFLDLADDLPDLLAQAWDEGYRLDWTGGVRHPNPHRQEANHG